MEPQEIRKAHFVFGNDPKDYCTTNSLDYSKNRRGPPFEIQSTSDLDLKSSHLPITSKDPLLKESISRITYIKHPIDNLYDNTDKMRYLRGSHFALGDGNFDALPEYRAAYVNKGPSQSHIDEERAKDIRGSHIE